jgi:hypothetical protein
MTHFYEHFPPVLISGTSHILNTMSVFQTYVIFAAVAIQFFLDATSDIRTGVMFDPITIYKIFNAEYLVCL